jgi:hypothetical protein
MLGQSTGELTERPLDHESGEAHALYRSLLGPMQWLQRLLAERGHEDVGGLDVLVDDVLGVSGVEAIGDFDA